MSEVPLRRRGACLLEDLLEGLEPGGQEVAVEEHDPLPARRARLQHLLCRLALALLRKEER